jgi:hypothetical protein
MVQRLKRFVVEAQFLQTIKHDKRVSGIRHNSS